VLGSLWVDPGWQRVRRFNEQELTVRVRHLGKRVTGFTTTASTITAVLLPKIPLSSTKGHH
jgi:hypothetical protein